MWYSFLSPPRAHVGALDTAQTCIAHIARRRHASHATATTGTSRLPLSICLQPATHAQCTSTPLDSSGSPARCSFPGPGLQLRERLCAAGTQAAVPSCLGNRSSSHGARIAAFHYKYLDNVARRLRLIRSGGAPTLIENEECDSEWFLRRSCQNCVRP